MAFHFFKLLHSVLPLLNITHYERRVQKDQCQPDMMVSVADFAVWNDCGLFEKNTKKMPGINRMFYGMTPCQEWE